MLHEPVLAPDENSYHCHYKRECERREKLHATTWSVLPSSRELGTDATASPKTRAFCTHTAHVARSHVPTLRILLLRTVARGCACETRPTHRIPPLHGCPPTAAAAMPTPHQSFHMSQQSPQQSSSQPNGHGAYGANHGYNVSFDGNQQQHQSASQPAPATYAQSFPNGPVSNPGYARSFGEGAMSAMRQYNEKPQIYTVCEMSVRLSCLSLKLARTGCLL